MYKKTNKIVASIIVFMMLLTHVSVIGTHAGEVFANTDVNNQNTKTNHSNVEFDVYFVEGESKEHDVVKNIGEENEVVAQYIKMEKSMKYKKKFY